MKQLLTIRYPNLASCVLSSSGKAVRGPAQNRAQSQKVAPSPKEVSTLNLPGTLTRWNTHFDYVHAYPHMMIRY